MADFKYIYFCFQTIIQAKRLCRRLDRFREVELAFSGLDWIQACSSIGRYSPSGMIFS